MKTDNPDGNDAALRALLKEWKPEPALPPRFQEQVWGRIERAETTPTPSPWLASVFANWITNLLPKPALAMSYATVLLAIGAGVGWSRARQETARVADELGARYARAVDPYQARTLP